MMTKLCYAPTAYDSTHIPQQAAQPAKRSWISRNFNYRLPWGNTEEIAPPGLIEGASPSFIREKEAARAQTPEEAVQVDFHQRIDHERFRYAKFSARTMFWLYLEGLGKWTLFILLPLMIITILVTIPLSETTWQEDLQSTLAFSYYALGIPLACWALGASVNRLFPDWVFKPSRGPLWEFNRRTGTVTLFKYGITGKPAEVHAPFCEFDAFVSTVPDRQGLPMSYLHLAHRYQPIVIDLAPLLGGPQRHPEEWFALWDMLQNFMDTTHPLPDIPLWEEYRMKDPVTAEHDRQIQRPSRYWRDMDDKTFKLAMDDMRDKVRAIDTRGRRNLMANHVAYAD